MSAEIQTFAEWNRNPSYHGSYDDYVRHMQAAIRSRQRESEERIANLVVKKLKASEKGRDR